MKKLISILVAFAMMATLAVSMAFAEDTYYTAQPLNIDITVVEGQALPTLTDTVTFTTTDAGAAPISTINLTKTDFTKATEDPADTAKDTYNYNVANVVPAANQFAHAGVYTYTITRNIAVTAPVNSGATSVLTPATSETYTMKVYVVDNGGTLAIQAVTLADSTGKINTTDDGTQEPIGYENDYFEKLPEGSDDNPAFDDYIVEKQVADGQGDKTKTFVMEGTLNLAGLEGQEVTAFIRDKTGAKTTRTVNFDASTGAFSAAIADDEQIVFKGLPIGTTYTADENDPSEGGAVGQYVARVDNGSGTFATKGTKTTVTNTINAETPAGILISNLPYIALALVAIGGLVAYVVVRRRNADEA